MSSSEAIIAITKYSVPSLAMAILRAAFDIKAIQFGLNSGGEGLGRIGRQYN